MLDEIDAALDATNVARVANFIREKTREDSEGFFQSIVISLKVSKAVKLFHCNVLHSLLHNRHCKLTCGGGLPGGGQDECLPAHATNTTCLQDNFFGKADALIGVCKDTENSCSATLTFDLNRFASDA